MDEVLIGRIAKIASMRHGAVKGAQMRALGASRDWIHRHARAGWFTHVGHDEYVLGPRTVTNQRRCALDMGGDRSMLIGSHGIDVWGLPTTGLDLTSVEVWAPTQRRPRDGVAYSRRGWMAPSDTRRRDGLDVARRAVCIASVAAVVEPVDLVKLINEACFRERDVDRQLHAIVAANPRMPGRRNLVTALDWYEHGHCGLDSRTEKMIRAELRRLGAPDSMVNPYLMLSDGRLRVDMYWPAAGLVLEVNPVGHEREWVRNADLGRVARIERDELDVVSLDLTRSPAVQQRVLEQVAARAHEHRPGSRPAIVGPARRRRAA